MAEIYILPFAGRASDQQARLAWQLTKAFEKGVDLGSRVPHIRAAAAVLLQTRSELRAAVDALLADMPLMDAASKTAVEAVAKAGQDFLREVEALAICASRFPGEPERPQN